MTPLPVCIKCRAIRTSRPDQVCWECMDQKKLRYDRDVLHSCPKLGKGIIIDTSKTKSCLSCGFQVHKLAIRTSKHTKVVMACHFIPVVIIILLTYLTDIDWLHILAIALPMNLTAFFAGRWMIAQNSVDWHNAMTQESFNWNMRKR